MVSSRFPRKNSSRRRRTAQRQQPRRPATSDCHFERSEGFAFMKQCHPERSEGSAFMRRLVCLALVCLTLSGVARAQITAQGAAMAPSNDLPNPYRTIEGWAQLGRAWGATSAVDIDRDGQSIWVAERCGANS